MTELARFGFAHINAAGEIEIVRVWPRAPIMRRRRQRAPWLQRQLRRGGHFYALPGSRSVQ